MKEELNIAAIMKDKPENTKLWSPIFGECEVRHINDDIDNSVSVVATYSLSSYEFIKDGRLSEKGECMLFPSKRMRDWSKFAWKKGDVLESSDKLKRCIFKEWANDDYTAFNCFAMDDGWSDYFPKINVSTFEYHKADDYVTKLHIERVEKKLGGKLNINTLQIEKQPEFKDGDIVYMHTKNGLQYVFVYDANKEMLTSYIVAYCITLEEFAHIETQYICRDNMISVIHLATNPEKQQLFDALAKENKKWDEDKKMLVDLPKKCEFKPMDWCLMRGGKEHFISDWILCQFSHKMECGKYRAIGGCAYDECIPYNDQTKHLLGTTDEWKGGEG